MTWSTNATTLARATKLDWWRQEVGRPSTAAAQPSGDAGAEGRTLKGFNLPQEQLLEIIDGMEMDPRRRATSTSRPCTSTATASPAWSACSPPRSSATGPPDAQVRPRPRAGLPAHQHHPRRRRGRPPRPHLPADRRTAALRRAGADLLEARYSDAFRELMAFQAERAEPALRPGLRPAARDRPQGAAPGLIMAAIYRACSTRSRATVSAC
jgi:phytoene synthase